MNVTVSAPGLEFLENSYIAVTDYSYIFSTLAELVNNYSAEVCPS